MIKFNLNDYVLVQITEYGWEHLLKEKHDIFADIRVGNPAETLGELRTRVIKKSAQRIDGETWYEMQAWEVLKYFGSATLATHPTPILSNILIPCEQ